MKTGERTKHNSRRDTISFINKSADTLVITLVAVSLLIALFGIGLYISLDGSSTGLVSGSVTADTEDSGQQTGFVSIKIIEPPYSANGDQE